jgi:hypothetical protein
MFLTEDDLNKVEAQIGTKIPESHREHYKLVESEGMEAIKRLINLLGDNYVILWNRDVENGALCVGERDLEAHWRVCPIYKEKTITYDPNVSRFLSFSEFSSIANSNEVFWQNLDHAIATLRGG